MKVSNRTWLQNTTKLEKRYVPLIEKLTMRLREAFIADLKRHGKDYAIQNMHIRTIINEPLLRVIDDLYKNAGLMGARMTFNEIMEQVRGAKKIPLKAVKAAPLDRLNAGFGRNDRWIRDVQGFLRIHRLFYAKRITETMRDDIVALLEKAVEEGASIDEMVILLRQADLPAKRARLIARTEVIRAANVGHAIAATDLPYEVSKTWSAAFDTRTRDSHVFINGNTVDENDTFKVPIYKGRKRTNKFDLMQFPGDPGASAGNVCNCRCRVLYNPKRDENGRLVMRNPNQARVIPMTPIERIPASGIAAALKAHITITTEI